MRKVLFAILVALSASSMAGIRCKGDLIQEGDSVSKLMGKCPRPTYVDREWVYANGVGREVTIIYLPNPLDRKWTYRVRATGGKIRSIREHRD